MDAEIQVAIRKEDWAKHRRLLCRRGLKEGDILRDLNFEKEANVLPYVTRPESLLAAVQFQDGSVVIAKLHGLINESAPGVLQLCFWFTPTRILTLSGTRLVTPDGLEITPYHKFDHVLSLCPDDTLKISHTLTYDHHMWVRWLKENP